MEGKEGLEYLFPAAPAYVGILRLGGTQVFRIEGAVLPQHLPVAEPQDSPPHAPDPDAEDPRHVLPDVVNPPPVHLAQTDRIQLFVKGDRLAPRLFQQGASILEHLGRPPALRPEARAAKARRFQPGRPGIPR